MLKKKKPTSEINSEFKVVIAANNSDNDQLKIHQSPTSLKSLESFSRSSESLALPVTPLVSLNSDKEKRKKKSRSATRSHAKEEIKQSQFDDSNDFTVSRDQGESFMSEIMRNVNKESKNIIGDCEEERLRIMNIRLESKLSRLQQESESIFQDRLEIKTELETAKQNFSRVKEVVDVLEEDYDSVKRERDLGKTRITELESSLAQNQSEMHSKIIDFDQISNELHEFQDKYERAKDKIRMISDDLESRNAVVVDLKKKISEFHSQLELMKLYEENSEYKVEQLELERVAIKNARNWFQDQLKIAEETKDKLQAEVHRVTQCLLETNHENENILQKNRLLELKLTKFQEVKLNETTQLLFELEQLQKEIAISEEEKHQLENQYSDLVAKNSEKVAELQMEQERVRAVSERAKELAVEVEDLRFQYETAQANTGVLELEVGELRRNVAVLEDRIQSSTVLLDEARSEQDRWESRCGELSTAGLEKDGVISGLKEDMTTMRVSLDRVLAERNQAYQGIERLHDEISQVETQFEQTRQDLADKEKLLKLADELNEELKLELAQKTDLLVSRDEAITLLRDEKDGLIANCQQFQFNQTLILSELESLRASLQQAHLRIAGLEDELAVLGANKDQIDGELVTSKEELEKFRSELTNAREKLVNLSTVQESYSTLFNEHKLLEQGYNELVGRHQELNDEYRLVAEELRSKLTQREDELGRLVCQKDEIAVSAQKNLLMADQSRRDLQNELETCKFAHAVELATKDDQMREQYDQSARQLSEMVQEKIRCEAAIASLQKHIGTVAEEYERKLGQCRSKMLHLQQQSTEYAEYEARCRQLSEELESKKGELDAVLLVWKSMKRHTECVENSLASRDADLHRIAINHDELITRRDGEIAQLRDKLTHQCERAKIEENMKNNFMGQLEERVIVVDQLRKKIDVHESNNDDLKRQIGLLQADYDAICRENQLLKESKEKLSAELDHKVKESWQLTKKNQELLETIEQAAALKDVEKKSAQRLQKDLDSKCVELKLGDKRNEDLITGSRKAMDELSTVIKDVTNQNNSLSRKIELSQQQEIIMSAILNQLRGEVKKIVFQQEVECGMANSVKLSSAQLDQLKKLLKETNDSTLSFRPHTRLSKCIEDLRTQVDSMQSEISKQLEEQFQF